MQQQSHVLWFLAIVLCSPIATTHSQEPTDGAKPEILVVGTFHMANRNRDLHDIQVDDMLSSRRQRELEELSQVLKRFAPTKIAIEEDVSSHETGQRYADYLAGRYTLSRDETDQIGFRVGKALGLKAIYPVNESGDFPYYRVLNYAKANGLGSQFAQLDASVAARVKQQDAYLQSHTILETLTVLNADSSVAADVAAYFADVPYGDPNEYAGPDLVAAWYQRNIRIYHNIRALATAPGDRILVIYGAGHLGWLQQDAANDAAVRLRKLREFTPPQ